MEYNRRFLQSHNPHTSPRKTPRASPSNTPTKPQSGGDRYIPQRQPLHDDGMADGGGEWATRFMAISPQIPLSTAGNTHNSSPANRRLFGGPSRPPTLDAGQPPPVVRQVPLPSAPTGNTPSGSAPSGTSPPSADVDVSSREHMVAHRALLANEMLGAHFDDLRTSTTTSTPNSQHVAIPTPATSHGGLFTYRIQRTPTKETEGVRQVHSESRLNLPSLPHSRGQPQARRALHYDTRFSVTPLSETSQRLLKSPRKPPRKINKNPYKVLDAPDLTDDFYLNLVDWSAQNTLAVGLGHCVYLWNAQNSQVNKLCDLSSEEGTEHAVSSVQWTEKGDQLAVGTKNGNLQIWDVQTQQRLHNVGGHSLRVCTGSRDRHIIQRDMRCNPETPQRRLVSHKQEVCGLKWSPDHQYLASGGNDNQLLIWSLHKDRPVQTYTQHVAAVKARHSISILIGQALAWCPHQHGLLVSGGGTADRCLRFWNTLTNQAMHCIDTGSQVCNVLWSKHTKELVSTHGYSQNQIVVWSYPTLQQVAVLKGHTHRVLYLVSDPDHQGEWWQATSPDGESIVTGAGDETLRFWHVFNKNESMKEERSQLSFYTAVR